MSGDYGYQSSKSLWENDLQRLVQNISSNIQKISQNVSSMQKMIIQLGTSQDTHNLRDQLNQVQHYTGQLAKDTNIQLKELQHYNFPSQSSDQRQFKMQKERLTNDFTSILNSFQQAQRTAAQKEKEAVRKAKANQSGFPHIEKPDERDDAPSSSLIEMEVPQQIEDELNIESLKDRERAICQLEIFKDLATMVHEESSQVDSIEANLESTHIGVAMGTQQLNRASRYQSRARKRTFIIAFILLILFAFIIGIIAWNLS